MDGAKSAIDLGRNYTPNDRQLAFHQSRAQARLVAGSVGSGKTKALCREAFNTALSHPGSLGVIIRYEYTALMDSTWRTFRRELVETGLDKVVKITGGNSPSSPPHVTFPPELGGSEILFRNAKRVEQLLGTEPDWYAFDEGAEIPDEIYLMAGGRLRGTPRQHWPFPDRPDTRVFNEQGVAVAGPLRFWIATNPGPSEFLRTRFRPPGVPGKPAEGFEHFHLPTLKWDAEKKDYVAYSPYLPDSYIKWLKEQFTGARFEAYALGNWGAFEGQVFTDYDPAVHLVDDIQPGFLAGRDIYEGWDFGRAVETAVVWIAVDPTWRSPAVVFADYGAKEKVPAEHAKIVHAVRRKFGLKNVIAVGDPAGGQRQAGDSYFTEYAKHGIHIAPSRSGKSQAVRDSTLGQLLTRRIQTPEGSIPALTFCKRCEHGVVASMLKQQYLPDKGDQYKDRPDERSKKDDHRLDAMEYGICAIPPPPQGSLENFKPSEWLEGVHQTPTPRTAHLFTQTDNWAEV